MHPIRRKRLIAVAFLLAGAALTVALVLRALNENLNLFYPPSEVVSGEAPVGARIRAGGMVKNGSVKRSSDSVDVSFVVTDLKGAEFTVVYAGILPDLFREGKGVLATGKLDANGVFHADEVLAKHDENYMPPELASMDKRS
jgi:cytochrome c-type biogenesis protein CcmE